MEKWQKWALGICLFLAWAFFFRKRATMMAINKADFFFLILVLGYFSGAGYLDSQRYKTSQFVSNPIHGSVSLPPVKIGDFAIIRLGGFNTPWREEGKQATVIIPYKSMRKHYENLSSAVQVIPINKNKLPHEVFEYIEKHGLKSPFYFGLYPDIFPLEYVKHTEHIKELNQTINILKQIVQGNYKQIKLFNSEASNASQSFNKPQGGLANLFAKKE